MKKHTTMKISTALNLSDKELEALFSDDAESLKKGFKEEEANGHIYIGSEDCDGFDPVTGCPGHPD